MGSLLGAVQLSNSQLDDAQKLTYLREAIRDPKATPLLFRATVASNQYEDLVLSLVHNITST